MRIGRAVVYFLTFVLIGAPIWFVSLQVKRERTDQSLIQAVSSQDLHSVRTLLADGANPNARISSSPPLNPLEQCRRLLRLTPVATAPNYSVLIQAARSGNNGLISLLLEYGADIRATDRDGHGVASYAANRSSGGALDLEAQDLFLDSLLQRGANATSAGIDEPTLLLECLRSGYVRSARHLIASGADIGDYDARGWNALFWAISLNDPQATHMLLARGANPNGEATGEERPLLNSIRCSSSEVVALLLRYGADVNVTDWRGDTALALAAGTDVERPDLVRLLLEHGAALDAYGSDGCVALVGAAYRGHLVIVRLLVNAGAGINVRCGWRGTTTPLHAATAGGYADMVRFLISKGANVNIQNDRGQRPLAIAVMCRHAEIESVLKQAGGRE